MADTEVRASPDGHWAGRGGTGTSFACADVVKPESTTPQEELGIIGSGCMGGNLALQAIEMGLGVVGVRADG
jgi:hypothetical protein